MRETVTFEEMITSKDKCMSILLRQMEKMITNDHILAAHGMFTFGVVWYNFMSKQTCPFF